MVPQIPAEEGEVWLYKASPSSFPRGFKFHRVRSSGAAGRHLMQPLGICCCICLGAACTEARTMAEAAQHGCCDMMLCMPATVLFEFCSPSAGAVEGSAGGREHCAPQPQVVAGGQRCHGQWPRCVRQH